MSDLTFRASARSETGLMRSENEDAGWAGQRLIAVADGIGGHVAGEVASAVAIASVSPLDGRVDKTVDVEGLSALLKAALSEAEDRIGAMIAADPALDGMGTTLTALLIQGESGVLLHIGDTRAYLLRSGSLQLLTRDDTVVQDLIDEGRIAPEDAEKHPQRSMMTQALMGRRDLNPAITRHEIAVGDRFLLCSDGLSGVVSSEQIQLALAAERPADAVNTLITLAHDAGAPDNVTVVVADVIASPTNVSTKPAVGSARRPPRMPIFNPRFALPRLPRISPYLLIGALIAVFALLLVGRVWSQSQYFVASYEGKVAIYRGLAQPVGPLELSDLYATSTVVINELPLFEREQLTKAITASGLQDAERIVARLQERASACNAQRARGDLGPLDCG